MLDVASLGIKVADDIAQELLWCDYFQLHNRLKENGLGFFNPVARGAETELRLALDRVDYWTGVGAQVSPRVAQLVKSFQSRQAGGQAAA